MSEVIERLRNRWGVLSLLGPACKGCWEHIPQWLRDEAEQHDADDTALARVAEAVAAVDWDAVLEYMRPTALPEEMAEVRAVREALEGK